MKRILYCALLFTGLSIFSACSNGDYIANPAAAANNSINPLDPLKKTDFTWTGTDPVSAEINGNQWVAETATYVFDSGRHYILAMKGNSALVFNLTDVWRDNLYNMGYGQFNTNVVYMDSFGGSVNDYFASYQGNSGGLYMLQNDTIAIKGLFYFQGLNAAGGVRNVIHGYFNIAKPF